MSNLRETRVGTDSHLDEDYIPLDGNGWEIPDPTPVAMPVGFKRPETLAEQVRRLVRTTISREAAEAGAETFEESEDFDIPDDPVDPSTPFEEWYDPVLDRGITAQEFNQNFETYRNRYVQAQDRAYQELELSDALRRPGRYAQDPGDGAEPRDSSKAPEAPPSPVKTGISK